MSVLPGGQPLEQALPDLDVLLEEPHAYLLEAPLAIGPRRMYRLALLFALPGLAFLLSCVIEGKPNGERLSLGVGLLIGSAVWVGWSLLLRGHELVLHPDGLEITHRDQTIWAPWALFHVEGRPFVPQIDSPSAGLTLPIAPEMVPFVQMRQHGMVIAQGGKVQGPQWRFSGHEEVILPARYEIDTVDLGDLLMLLGNRLGKETPPGKPPPDADPLPPSPIHGDDPAGWITLPLTRLRMPACCSRCGGPRDDTLPVSIQARGDWIIGPFLGGESGLRLDIPVCETCREVIASRQRLGGFWGLALGCGLGTVLGGILGVWLGEGRDLGLYIGLMAGFFLGLVIGTTAGLSWSRRLPVRFRRYSPSRGLISVRFQNPQVGSHVLHALRHRDKPDLS